VSRRNVISGLIAEQLAAANSPRPAGDERPPARIAAGPVRTMGLTLERLELERKSLEDALASGGGIIEIDPALVDGSFAADRFAEANDPAFEELKRSIAENGQEVPIMVRPLAEGGRYQAAYGHRRLRACQALGRPVRALVRPLSDAQLVIAQGLENASRVDLSFIEKASFARGLEDRGFERATIMAALSTDKTELSKLISTARALPEHVVRAIGPAPRAGRRRWMKLAELLADPAARDRVEALPDDPAFGAAASDARFVQALTAAAQSPAESAEKAPMRVDLRLDDGTVLASIRETRDRLDLSIDRAQHIDFANFLVRELAEIHRRFLAEGSPSPSARRRR
jgi:ParB family chromosome partitioning protein